MKARWLVALLIALAIPARLLAAEAATPTLVVTVDPGSSGVDPAAVRAEIARELGVTVSSTPTPDARGTIEVAIGERSLTVRYTERGGETLSRTVDRPKDRADEIEVIALLAGNLARDEARELAEGLAPKPAPGTGEPPGGAEAAPPPAPPPKPTPKPAAEPAAKPAPKPRAGRRERQVAPEEKELPSSLVNLSLFHPISLFVDSERREFNVALGLAYSRLGRLRGAAVDLGVLRTDVALQGAAVTGLWTWSRGTTDGVVVSGVFSTGEGRLRGGEASVAFNYRDAAAQGLQLAVGFNRARELEGAQIAVGFNRVEHDQPSYGAQAAAALNLADRLTGAQIALVNVGGDVDGTQIGLVNVGGHVRGAQIGLLNVARRVDGLSLAPIGILAENRIHALIWSDTVSIVNGGVKYSTGRLYSLLAVGGDPAPAEDRALGAGGAIGVHIFRSDPWFADFDVLYRFVPDSGNGVHSTAYRLLGGWQLAPVLGLVAGGGVEHHTENDEHSARVYGTAGLQFF